MNDNILILDTSIGSLNKGDEIIMECVREELEPIISQNFELTLPTHISPFHWYQVLRNSIRVRKYSNCKYKFVGGTNLLIPNLFTHFPQWNINIFNYQPLSGCVLVGVGAGACAEDKIKPYTKYIYTHLLNNQLYHSCRDERSKQYVERLGLKALNTGCVTMWKLTPEFCKLIPTIKSNTVVFTLTATQNPDKNDQILINTLNENYDNVYFWPQGDCDYNYLQKFNNINKISIIPATKNAYHNFLTQTETDYIGTRLHGGVYAMRHKRRSIIIAIDERARAINENNNLICIERNEINTLKDLISQQLETKISMPFENITKWKKQFSEWKI